jgi:ATP-dependent helicase HrpA
LYGLVVYSQRRINFGLINPVEAREIFIRDALVGGEFDTRAPFFAFNNNLIREIENLEHKSRRLDVLVDDELIAAFYDKMLPAHICNGISFEKWHKDATRAEPKLLYLNRDELMRHEAAGITTELFPKLLPGVGIEMPLAYHFEPGTPRDGVTLTVPLFALNQLSPARCDWLVPGMLKEKVHLLLKSLPQKLRRNCVPLPHYAAAFLDRVNEQKTFGRGSLIEAIIADVRVHAHITPLLSDFKAETLPAHHFMNFKVIDEHGRQLEMGRNLGALQAEFGGQARESFQKIAESTAITNVPVAQVRAGGKSVQPVASASAPSAAPTQHQKLTAWTFGELPELLEIQQGKLTLIGFPALVDKGAHCDLEVFDDPTEAARIHRGGLRRLLALQLREQLKYLEKNIPGLQQMGMQFMALGSQEELRDQIIEAGLERACLQEPLPRTAAEFDLRKEAGKSRLGLLVNEIARLVGLILAEYYALPKKLQGAKGHAATVTDIQAQLQGLVGKRFVTETSYTSLTQFPRYLKAVNVRLEKLRIDPARDVRWMSEWQQAALLWQRGLKEKQSGHTADPKMGEFRWLLEELRVSLFAQELKTPMPVSVKRLQKVWESMQR